MVAQPLDHAARPAPALARERAPVGRRLGERDGGWLEHAASALGEHAPGQHDVLADAVRPAPGELQRGRVVDAEGALRDERALQQGLGPLDAGDAEEVVPLLRACEQVLARVAHQHRPCDGGRVRR